MDPISAAFVLSLITGAGNYAIGSQNASSIRANNLRNIEFAVQQQDKQNQFNLDMWNRTNAYNSPASVMDRLHQAGLNPNLAYGDLGTGMAVNMQSVGADYQGQAPLNLTQMPDLGQSVLSGMAEKRQQEIATEQVENLDLKNTWQELMNKSQEIQNAKDQYDLDHYDENKIKERELLSEAVKSAKKSNDLLDRNIESMTKQLVLLDDEHDLNQIKKLLNALDFSFQFDTYDLRKEDIAAGVKLKKAESAKCFAAAKLYTAKAVYVELDNLMRKQAYDKGINPYIDAHNKLAKEIDLLSEDVEVRKLEQAYQKIANAKGQVELSEYGIEFDKDMNPYIKDRSMLVLGQWMDIIGDRLFSRFHFYGKM